MWWRRSPYSYKVICCLRSKASIRPACWLEPGTRNAGSSLRFHSAAAVYAAAILSLVVIRERIVSLVAQASGDGQLTS